MKRGKCHLCGNVTVLSFEHVPPQKAFNSLMVMRLDIDRLMARVKSGETTFSEAIDVTEKIYEQKGSGAYTLCQKCNNDTGSWYVNEYVRFTWALYRYCHEVKPGYGITARLPVKPLHVLKQILTMFCSACGAGFAEKTPTLVRYLLNKESRDFPYGIELWAGLFDVNNSMMSRQHGLSGLISEGPEKMIVMSEISYPPFVYVMTVGDTGPPDERLQPIGFMKNFRYDEETELQLNLFTLSVKGPYPGSYESPKATRL